MAADAYFIGFIVEDNSKLKNNKWYEIEGVLTQTKDNAGYDIMIIKPINIKEINSKDEEQYVYPCYSYGDGSCKEMDKYDFSN